MPVAWFRRRPRSVVVGAAVVAVLAGSAAAVLVAGSGAPGVPLSGQALRATVPRPGGPKATVPPSGVSGTTAPTTTTTTTTTTTVPATPGPGNLPQTATMPSAGTPQFDAEMAALWDGVVAGSVGPAMPAFFPEAAYLQVKTLDNPAADYQDRLVAEYAADISAARTMLGADPASATLVDVEVPTGLVHWVTPGTCANDVGYFEVPNARVVYRQGDVIRSFGIASLISWRGVWYVVHLGSVLRSGSAGVVDDPASGAGVSAPYLTC